MRGWDETEVDHASRARQATLELAGSVEQLVSTFEMLRARENLERRAHLVGKQLEVTLEQLRSVEAAIVSVNNIADFRGREPDHPGTP